jgi:hypothetical protein
MSQRETVESEVAAIAQQYAKGIENVCPRSLGLKASDFEPIIHEACKKSAVTAALHAGEIIEGLRDELLKARHYLIKYQARYHGTPHALKFWTEVDAFLMRTSSTAQAPEAEHKNGEARSSCQPG